MNRRTLGCLFELLETLLLTLIVFLVVQLFAAQPYQVQQESMENTLMPNQYVLVDKLSPRFDPYHRGDIVVFTPPATWLHGPPGTPYIKRVIGIGGDTVAIQGGHVLVNGVQLSEPYVFQDQQTQVTGNGSKTWTLSSTQLFVMGDHRQASQDSRDFGPIDKSEVIGRAWIRYWPLSQFGLIPKADATAAPSGSPASSPSP
ncbi:MAG: signal peptidase I [Candidatus Limnocylindrales bacterium]